MDYLLDCVVSNREKYNLCQLPVTGVSPLNVVPYNLQSVEASIVTQRTSYIKLTHKETVSECKKFYVVA
jgi:hypothetical protein